MQDKIYNLITKESEITWQSIIYDLVKKEEMDPWDIDITKLTQKYLQTIKTLQEHNFNLSGKIVLASSILLRLKTHRLLTEHIPNFDQQLFPADEDLLEEMENNEYTEINIPNLLIKTPQARRRKLKLNELVGALTQALDVNNRRLIKRKDEELIRPAEIPQKKVDITNLIKNLYSKITSFFTKSETITFSQLIPSESKEDKIYTFIPMLHLVNEGKIDINQEEHFGEIFIKKG
jgi:segregation and condensation protein A